MRETYAEEREREREREKEKKKERSEEESERARAKGPKAPNSFRLSGFYAGSGTHSVAIDVYNFILNIYETFDKKNKKKHADRKSGELDEKTKEKQQQAKIEEEKYDHLLNSMQAQTLIKAVEKYGKDEEDRKEIDAIPIELPKEKSDLDKITKLLSENNIDFKLHKPKRQKGDQLNVQ